MREEEDLQSARLQSVVDGSCFGFVVDDERDRNIVPVCSFRHGRYHSVIRVAAGASGLRGPIAPVSTEHADPVTIASADEAEAVVLDLVGPARAVRH